MEGPENTIQAKFLDTNFKFLNRCIKKGGIQMVKKRTDERIVFSSMGMVDGNDEQVSCTLENVSPSGALIRMGGPVPATLQMGDIIHLKTILLSPVELQCKVVRIDADQIAVQFIDL